MNSCRIRGDAGSGGITVLDPSGLAASSVTSGSLTLDWTINDPSSYATEVYQDGVLIATVLSPTATYSVTGLSPSTSYVFAVKSAVLALSRKDEITQATSSGHHYGWPFGGTTEPDVAAQWTFQEASGPIVDGVASISLAGAGTRTYQVAGSGAWGTFKGVTFGSGGKFTKRSADAALDFGTGPITFEAVVKTTNSTSYHWIFTSQDQSTPNAAGISINTNGSNVSYALYCNDGSSFSNNFACSGLFDGAEHHLRFVFNRAGNATVYLDDNLVDTYSLSSIAGLAITSTGESVSEQPWNATYNWDGWIGEIRISKNLTNNSFV